MDKTYEKSYKFALRSFVNFHTVLLWRRNLERANSMLQKISDTCLMTCCIYSIFESPIFRILYLAFKYIAQYQSTLFDINIRDNEESHIQAQ